MAKKKSSSHGIPRGSAKSRTASPKSSPPRKSTHPPAPHPPSSSPPCSPPEKKSLVTPDFSHRGVIGPSSSPHNRSTTELRESTQQTIAFHRSQSNVARKVALSRGRDIYPIPNLASSIFNNGGVPVGCTLSPEEYNTAGELLPQKVLGEIPPGFRAPINWERRLACKRDLRLFDKTYLPAVFTKGWSKDQLRCVERQEQVFLEGGLFALAMPRAGGKTAMCRGAIIWGSAYAHRKFMYFVGSTQPKAQQTLEFIKTYWYRSAALQQDFPEIAWPIYKLENRFHLASGQTYGGSPTNVDWGSEMVRFPCILFSREDAQEYLDHDPSSMIHLDPALGYGDDTYLPAQAGLMIATAGVDGSIRGEADVHPILLEQPRPDLVLLDDVQKDSKADSPTSCEKLIRLIDGAVSGLSGPGEHIAALMPCTVIREGDVSDTYLDSMQKPDWNGERCRLVIRWPDGITDFEINQDTAPGRHWNAYNNLRKVSLLAHKDIRLARDYYTENRVEMDQNFEVSWDERFSSKGRNWELSAQQHAMELRFKSPATFCAEYQNIGRKLVDEGEILITADQLMRKTIACRWGELPIETEMLVGFIDVQNEGMPWQLLACDFDFNGIFPMWGLFPEIDTNYWTHTELDSWSLLTNDFFKTYPQFKKDASRTSRGYLRAPFEAKIYHGLQKLTTKLLGMEFTRTDTHRKKFKVKQIAIDTRYGKSSDVVKRFIRESGLVNTLVPYNGQAFPATNLQLEEYEKRPGWHFEHSQHPNVKESAWVIRPHKTDGSFFLQGDVSRLKDRLFARLASPKGSPGSISFPDVPAEKLELICNQICTSEYPEPIAARGIIKNLWKERDSRVWDNDYLDCSAGLIALAGVNGASVKTTDEVFVPRKRRLSDMYASKRRTA